MKLPTRDENLIKKIVQGIRPCWRLYLEFWVNFSVLGSHIPTPAPIGMKFGVEESKVDSSTPNFTIFGAMCRPFGAKNLKIAPWVTEILALCSASIAADNYTCCRFQWCAKPQNSSWRIWLNTLGLNPMTINSGKQCSSARNRISDVSELKQRMIDT